MRSALFSALVWLLLASCSLNPNADKQVVYIQVGDSITHGDLNPPGNAAPEFARQAASAPGGLGLIKLGYSGESAAEFYAKHRQQLLDTLPNGKRVILGVAFGANDLIISSKEQALADILRVVDWARQAGFREVLLVPVLNRMAPGSRPGLNPLYFQQFDASRTWLNEQLLAAVATRPGVHVAPIAASTAMYSKEAPLDITLFNDKVHPTSKGAKELGEGTIAHGIASFDDITLN